MLPPLRASLPVGGGPQTGEVTCGGSPHLSHVHVIKLKRDIIWTGGLRHLAEVPHSHVKRPLD